MTSPAPQGSRPATARRLAGRRLGRKAANLVFTGLSSAAATIALTFLALILWTLLQKGFSGINLDVFTRDTAAAGTLHGGLRNAIVGSLVICAIAMAISVVVGILAGTWLAELGGESRYGHVVRFLNDVLLSAPSILVGLAVYILLVKHGLHTYSPLAGGVALALLATPVVTRTTEDILRLQPHALREAGSALGTPNWLVIRKVVWRAAGGGLLTGALLGFARIAGETAPLLQTALGDTSSGDWSHPIHALTHPIAALPLVIYNNALSSDDGLVSIGWVGALLIAFAVLIINIAGRILAARAARQ